MAEQDAREWADVRTAAVAALTEVAGSLPGCGCLPAGAAERLADAVLAVCDEEAVNRMAAQFVEETRIRSMDFRNGMAMDLEPSQVLVANWAGAARGMLGDAPNYVEMDISLAGTGEAYTFRLERRNGKTPHQLRKEAEARAEAAEARVAELEAAPGEESSGG